jgi:hypothetical protein
MNDVKALRSLLIASLLATATTAVAEESPWKFEFHGFVVGTLYMQDQTFLLGQGNGLTYTAPAPSNQLPRPGVATDKSGTFLGGDVRQTRFIFNMSGPDAFGAKAKAHLEFDLFGNSNGGGLGYESPNPRLRQAFGQLTWGATSLDFGQHSADLLLAFIPATLSHITNPVTFGAGLLGWRTIGVRASHTVKTDAAAIELAGELVHGKWADAAGTTVYPGNAPNQISLAWSTGVPKIGARVKASGKAGNLSWMGFVAGAYEGIDLKGLGSTQNPAGVTLADGSVKTSISSYAAVVGTQLTFAPVTLQAQFYTGRGTYPLAGNLLQPGDIGDMGYYAQVGVFATKEISLWGVYGASSSDKTDVRKWGGSRSDNSVYGGMLRFMDAGYGIGLEYYANKTTWLTGTFAAPGADVKTDAYQVSLSGGYFF